MENNIQNLLIKAIKQVPKNKDSDDVLHIKRNSIKNKTEEILKIKQQAKEINISDIKTKYKVKEDLNLWTSKDFVYYMSDKYEKKYGHCWKGISYIGVTTFIPRIRDMIRDSLGICDNIVMKDFIDYYFNNWMQDSYQKEWFLRNMTNNTEPILKFSTSYNYKDSISKNIKTENKEVKTDISLLNENELEISYLLGIDNLLNKYGIIVTINFCLKKDFSLEKAIEKVAYAIARAYNRGVANSIFKTTEKYKDYGVFKDLNKVIEVTNDIYKINLKGEITKNV